jgi:hypothetical protein
LLLELFRQFLRKIARAALGETIIFGNPVTDFLPLNEAVADKGSGTNVVGENGTTDAQTEQGVITPPSSDERELLEHVVDIEDGFNALTDIVSEVSEALLELAAYADSKTSEIERINQMHGSGATLRKLNLAKEIATKLEEHSTFLKSKNDAYEAVWRRIDNSLEYIAAYPTLATADEKQGLMDFMKGVYSLEKSAVIGKEGFVGLRNSMAGMRGVQVNLTAASRSTESELTRFIENMDRTRASAARALEVGKRKLGLPDDYPFEEIDKAS